MRGTSALRVRINPLPAGVRPPRAGTAAGAHMQTRHEAAAGRAAPAAPSVAARLRAAAPPPNLRIEEHCGKSRFWNVRVCVG